MKNNQKRVNTTLAGLVAKVWEHSSSEFASQLVILGDHPVTHSSLA